MKKSLSLLLALTLTAALTGCSGSQTAQTFAAAQTTAQAAETESPETEAAGTEAPETKTEETEAANAEAPGAEGAEASSAITPEDVTVRVGSLKGPTSMGLVHLMDQSEKGAAGQFLRVHHGCRR